jgi:hypothetical protein
MPIFALVDWLGPFLMLICTIFWLFISQIKLVGLFPIQEPCRACHTVHIQIRKHINGVGIVQIWYFCIVKAWKPIFLNYINEYSLFTACNVKWLGLRGDDLQLIPQSAFQELKPRDLQIAKSLLSSKFLQVRLLFLNFSEYAVLKITYSSHSTNIQSLQIYMAIVYISFR